MTLLNNKHQHIMWCVCGRHYEPVRFAPPSITCYIFLPIQNIGLHGSESLMIVVMYVYSCSIVVHETL